VGPREHPVCPPRRRAGVSLHAPFRKPDSRDLAERFDNVRKWIRALETGGKPAQGYGYEIEWTEINHRQLTR